MRLSEVHRRSTKTRTHKNTKKKQLFSFVLLRFRGFVMIAVGLGAVAGMNAQSPKYHVGRAPTADEIKAWDIAVSPAGRELPPGRC